MPRYIRPTSTQEALAALAEEDGSARPLVGGTDLLVALRHHKVEPTLIVDLKGLTDVADPIQVGDTGIVVGPTATMGQLTRNAVVKSWFPALVEAALMVGSVAIRNRASLIGNSCTASPAADSVPALMVHDVHVTIASLEGTRTVPLSEFFLGPRQTSCTPVELVTRLELRRPEDGFGSAFQRLTRRRGVDLATVSAAASIDGSGHVVLGLGAVGPRTLRTELSSPFDPDDPAGLTAALDDALQVATPISDIRGGQAYRAATVRVLARRAVLAAHDRRHRMEAVA